MQLVRLSHIGTLLRVAICIPRVLYATQSTRPTRAPRREASGRGTCRAAQNGVVVAKSGIATKIDFPEGVAISGGTARPVQIF
jgi:hypothetical protein